MVIFSESADEGAVMEMAMSAGAENLEISQQGKLIIYCPPDVFGEFLATIKSNELQVEFAEVARIPRSRLDLDESILGKVIPLIESLKERDDIDVVNSDLTNPTINI